VAALTVYDMVKGVERGVEIARVRLEKARRQVGCGSRRRRNLLPSTVI
jgi:molybdenum cofactor biosynthesis enzyme